MGLGDVKLMVGIGFLLGMSSGATAILFAFWIGAVFSLLLLGAVQSIKGRELSLKTAIPFGPFLALGTIIVFLGQLDFGSILQFLGRF